MDQKIERSHQSLSNKSTGDAESSSYSSSRTTVSSYSQDSPLSPLERARSPEISSKPLAEEEGNEKSLAEKLSAALSNIKAKEDLVKQHAKVAEEAISGWEIVEKEASYLRQKLEVLNQNNAALQGQISHLDSALKICARQLNLAREEQDQKIQDAISRKTIEFEASKNRLKKQIADLQIRHENGRLKTNPISDFLLLAKLETMEKENAALKLELSEQTDEFTQCMLERNLSTQTGEDQLNGKPTSITKLVISEEDSLTDDFLQMERLAALSEAKSSNPKSEIVTAPDVMESIMGNPVRMHLQIMVQGISDMEKELQMTTEQKIELEKVLLENQNLLKMSKQLLSEANEKLEELHREVVIDKGPEYAKEVGDDHTKAEKKKKTKTVVEKGRFNSVSFKGKEGWIVGKRAILLYTFDTGQSWGRIPLSAQLPGDLIYIKATGEKSTEMVTDEGVIYVTSN